MKNMHVRLMLASGVCTFFVFIFGGYISVFGQHLQQTSDTARIGELFRDISKESNPDTAIVIYKELLQMALDAKADQHTKGIYLKIGEYYANKGDYQNALNYMQQGIPYNYETIDRASAYSHMGWVYVSMGDYVTASENFYNALNTLKNADEGDGRTQLEYTLAYRFLGMINFKLHQNEKALYYLDQGEHIARKSGRANFIAIMLNSKGDLYNDMKQPDSAYKYYSEARTIAQQARLLSIEAEANAGIGKSLIASKQYKQALYYLRLATAHDDNMDKNSMIDAWYYMGEALYRLGTYREAEDILVMAIKQAIASKSNDNIITGYATLKTVYEATGQYKKALECMDSLNVAREALESAEKAKDINMLDIKYRTAEKDKQIALQQSKIARKDTWILGIGSGVVLLMVISVAIYLNTLHKQRMNAARLKTIEKENKIEVLKAVVQGGDKERTHIARELHDGVGGMVSAAMMRFSALSRENEDIPSMPSYREAMKILNEVGDEIRKTAHSLMPDALLKQSLPEAVQAFCNSAQSSGNLQIEFQCMGAFELLAQPYKLNLYRIVQELIKNVIKHAHATTALVQLLLNEDVLIVSVEDNGVGFNVNEIKEGIGLYNMQTRANSLDGHFVLDSTPGKGTSVFIEFKNPLNNEDTNSNS